MNVQAVADDPVASVARISAGHCFQSDFHRERKYTNTASMVPVCSMISRKAHWYVGAAIETHQVGGDRDVRRAGNRQHFRRTLDDRENQNLEQMHR